jgi:hypothetical protein
MINQRFETLISGTHKLIRMLEHSFRIQPYFFLIVMLLRTAIRLLYFTSSILPFKILLVLSREYSIPSFLDSYFSSNVSLAYALCLFIGIAMLIAMALEKWIDHITQQKTHMVLGREYLNKPKRRNKLNDFIRQSTDVASSCVIIGLSIGLLLMIQYQIALVVIALTIMCVITTVSCSGKLDLYVASTPMKYLDNCLTGISLVSFFALVQISIYSITPPPFLSLIISLVLLRQFTISVEKVVSVGLFFNGKKDIVIERVFSRL